jgi:hypothetical protein
MHKRSLFFILIALIFFATTNMAYIPIVHAECCKTPHQNNAPPPPPKRPA